MHMRMHTQYSRETSVDQRAYQLLDVDDLAEGKGAEYVDASSVTLIFVSEGYFNSENCMRELLRAILTSKDLVVLLEPDARHGGLSAAQRRPRAALASLHCSAAHV